MSNFKNGDRVERLNGKNGPFAVDMTGTVVAINSDGSVDVQVDHLGGRIVNGNDSTNLKLIKSNNVTNNMNLIEKAKLAFKSEPEKSFIKAGVMDSNENLTFDGKELFLTYLLQKNKDDFKTTVIDPILAEDEAKAAK